MNQTESARAKCPYYKKIKDREIQCESCVKRARLVLVFHSQAEAVKHKRKYCDEYDWEQCEYARALNEKYGVGWVMDFKRGVER